jgi:hypothetical protein
MSASSIAAVPMLAVRLRLKLAWRDDKLRRSIMGSGFRVSRVRAMGALLLVSSMAACAPRLTADERYIIPSSRAQNDTLSHVGSVERRQTLTATGGLDRVEIFGLAIVLVVVIMGLSSR